MGSSELASSALGAVNDALSQVQQLAGYRRAIGDDEWTTLARISLFFAVLEALAADA